MPSTGFRFFSGGRELTSTSPRFLRGRQAGQLELQPRKTKAGRQARRGGGEKKARCYHFPALRAQGPLPRHRTQSAGCCSSWRATAYLESGFVSATSGVGACVIRWRHQQSPVPSQQPGRRQGAEKKESTTRNRRGRQAGWRKTQPEKREAGRQVGRAAKRANSLPPEKKRNPDLSFLPQGGK